MENIVESIGEKISKARGNKGWSQERLAAESDSNRRTVQNIEGNKVEDPGIKVVAKLARALDISVSYLIDDKPTRAERIVAIQARMLKMTEEQLINLEELIDHLENPFEEETIQERSKKKV